MMDLLQETFGWLDVLVSAGGAVVCGMNLGRSRWASLLTGAFVADAAVLAFFRVAVLLMQHAGFAASSFGVAFLLASAVGLAARAGVVAGVAGILSELARALVPPEKRITMT